MTRSIFAILLLASVPAALGGVTDNSPNVDDNVYLVGGKNPDQVRNLPSGGVVNIWHVTRASFFGLPPIPIPRLTVITLLDRSHNVKATLYQKDGVNQWIPGEQFLLMLRNIGEATPYESSWYFNKSSYNTGQYLSADWERHAQWRAYREGASLSGKALPPVSDIHLIVEINEDPGRVYMLFLNLDNGGLDLLNESGYAAASLRLPLDR